MERPAEHITLAGPLFQESAPRSPGVPAKSSVLPGLQSGALDELRSAACTYDFVRSMGVSMEFWEALRLARGRRGLKPSEGSALPAPSPGQEALLWTELEAVRTRFADLVRALRLFLKDVLDLPRPAERLEMALAFMMASSREHEFISLWLREPEKHRAKAAERLRSLTSITDAYREALKPWAVDTGAARPDAS